MPSLCCPFYGEKYCIVCDDLECACYIHFVESANSCAMQ